MAAALGRLSERERTAFALCRFEGMAYRDIAEVLSASEAAVKSLIHRATLSVARAVEAWQAGAHDPGEERGMSCTVEDELTAFVDGELSAVEAARVRGHLTSCSDCRSTEALLRRTLTELATLPGFEPSAGLRRRVLAEVDGAPAALAGADAGRGSGPGCSPRRGWRSPRPPSWRWWWASGR